MARSRSELLRPIASLSFVLSVALLIPGATSFVVEGNLSLQYNAIQHTRVETFSLNYQLNERKFEGSDESTKRSELLASSNHLQFFSLLSALVLFFPTTPSHALEISADIPEAVTTSDLGIRVRQSVVRGAQIMDQVDRQWERFSDNFGLGAERTKQGERPKPKVIPDLKPLNVNAAQRVLEMSDKAFLQAFPGSLNSERLQQEVENVAKLVQVPFARAGVTFLDTDHPWKSFTTGSQFDFVVYAHYKAYSNLLLEYDQKISMDKQKSFASIRSDFERILGQSLAEEWKIKSISSNSDERVVAASLTTALRETGQLAATLQDLGLAALVEPSSPIDPSDWQDFMDGDVSQLNWSIAVDGDVTLNAQILLQEQGYRLYPNFGRFVIQHIFHDSVNKATAKSKLPLAKVSVMDYYFDTDYNVDPSRFEVKEVLLDVSLEND